jgi:DNA-binding response OmpR family regulator
MRQQSDRMVGAMEVEVVRWPDEDRRRERLSLAGEPRLLLVEDGQIPPVVLDCLEDWVRVPAPEQELQARLDALEVRGRAHEHDAPGIDDHGVLRFGNQWVALSPVEARLTQALLLRFGAVVSRESLVRAGWSEDGAARNALDVHVLRLRRRLAPLGLAIRTVRSRGYLLEQRVDGVRP